jgi:hypothetical protein
MVGSEHRQLGPVLEGQPVTYSDSHIRRMRKHAFSVLDRPATNCVATGGDTADEPKVGPRVRREAPVASIALEQFIC